MNRNWIIKLILPGILLTTNLTAQTFRDSLRTTLISPSSIKICFNKTTHLIFPDKIALVDRGTRDVLAQKPIGYQNILQLKAGSKGFQETNLTVITTSGRLYSFIITYAEDPGSFIYQFYLDSAIIGKKQLFSPENVLVDETMESSADAFLTSAQYMKGPISYNNGISGRVTAIIIKGDYLYFRVGLSNRTNISYEVDQLEATIKDKALQRRAASQSVPVKLLYQTKDQLKLNGQTRADFICVYPKFGIAAKKVFTLQLRERGGNRNLEIKLTNKTILKAQEG